MKQKQGVGFTGGQFSPNFPHQQYNVKLPQINDKLLTDRQPQ